MVSLDSIKKEINESVLLMNEVDYATCHDVYRDLDLMQALGGDNFRRVCEKLELSGDSAFTVCGSGDQPLELVSHSFNHIDTFDINFLARHILHLKIAAILCLSYEEFMEFSKNLFLNINLFSRVLEMVPLETRQYFEGLFALENRDRIYNRLFTHKHYGNSAILEVCKKNFSFYNEKEFYILKERLKKATIVFQQRDLFASQNLKQTYDFMYFSNILLFSSVPLLYFRDFLLPNYIKHLNPGGVLVFDYFHYYTNPVSVPFNEKEYETQMKNKEVAELFHEYITEQIVLPPSRFGMGLGDADLALVYRKK